MASLPLPSFHSKMLRILIAVIVLIPNSQQETLKRDTRQSTCACGAVNRRTRIVGGEETEVNEYPWMAEIRQVVATTFRSVTEDLCGAALIDNQNLITAAHCFIRTMNISQLFVYLGDHDLNRTTETASHIIQVSKITIHPNYNNITHANDIAIIRLSFPIKYQSNIQPICIPPAGLDLTGQNITVTGWGSTETAGPYSNVLLEVTLPVIANKDCKKLYNGTDAVIDQSVICAGLPDGSKDACQADSGGPAIFQCDGVYSLAGVVSFGRFCGDPLYPGVYSNVSNYRSWIMRSLPGSRLCGSTCRPEPPLQFDCGWANNSPALGKRIVGGSVTTANEYPWMVSTYINSPDQSGNPQWEFECGATIISKDWLVTSARCVSGVALQDIFFVVGDYNVNVLNEPGEEVVFPSSIIVHSEYNQPFLANDIAVVKLQKSLTLSSYTFAVCIPSSSAISSSFSDTLVKLLGWGRNSTGGPYASQLKEVSLYAISNRRCRAYYGTTIQDTMVCTASSARGDACEGDTGGPLMLQGKTGRYYVVALQSFRHRDGCGSGNPSGNTRISQYASWIEQNTGVKAAATSDVLPPL